jgi:ABC-type multidrug transport system permease subunit
MTDMNEQSTDPGPSGVRAVSGIPATGVAASGIACLAKSAREYWWLLRGQLHQLRLQWFWYVVMMSCTPLITMAFLWFFTGRSPEALLFMCPSPVTIIIFILAGYSLAGLGAFVGLFSRDGQTAGLVTQIIDPLIVFLAPVYIPIERLPRFLQHTAKLLPTTYVANALRASVADRVTSATWREIGFLAAWTLLSLWAASRKLAWRANE